MKRIAIFAALVLASLAGSAQGPGYGPGYGPGGPGPGCGQGAGTPGCGPGQARGPAAPGWPMMTPEERGAHQDKMRGFRTPADCEAYMQEHHRLMQERARQRGQGLPWDGPRPHCDYLRKPA
jgi:hypothetical protein